MLTEDDIQQRYPLHTFVWKNSHSHHVVVCERIFINCKKGVKINLELNKKKV